MTHVTSHAWEFTDPVSGFPMAQHAPVYHNSEPVMDVREHLTAKMLRHEMLVKNSARYDAHDATAMNEPYAGEWNGRHA